MEQGTVTPKSCVAVITLIHCVGMNILDVLLQILPCIELFWALVTFKDDIFMKLRVAQQNRQASELLSAGIAGVNNS